MLCCSVVLHPWDRDEAPARRDGPRGFWQALNWRSALTFLRTYVALAAALLAIAFIAFTILWFAVDLLGG